MWLATQHRLWMSDRRARHGLQDAPALCYTCLQEEDNVDHILAHYVYAREVWHSCFHALSVNIQGPSTDADFLDWWLLQRQRFNGKTRRGFDSITIVIAWALWKQRNARVFNNISRQRTASQLKMEILDEIDDWRKAGLGGVGALDPFVRE